MKLFCKELGQGFPLIIIHGLYGSSDNWYSIGKVLSHNYKVYMVDVRNHGQSPHADSMTFDDMCSDLLEFYQHHNISKAILIGHSMGGKIAMQFALHNQKLIEKLIVVDIAPRSYMQLMEMSRQVLDHLNIINSLTNLDLNLYHTREAIDKELANKIVDLKTRQFLLKNIERSAEKKLQWRINIDAIRDQLPEIMKGIVLPKELIPPQFQTLFIKGEKSDYVEERDLIDIKKIFPKSDVVTIFDASHWVHAEQPELFLKTVGYFLEN
jgi:esterase